MSDGTTRVTLKLPDDIADAYEAEAKSKNKTLEALLVERLHRCALHKAAQPLYFNDDQRQELIHICGGHLITNADEALARIRSQASVKMGEVNFSLDQRRMTRLVSRARAEKRAPEVVAEREMKRGLDVFIGMN